MPCVWLGGGAQLDAPARSAWTLPYIITVNDEHPFGMYVSYPKIFEGQRDEEDDRLKWYATATTKDVIMSAQVRHETTVFDVHLCSALRECRVMDNVDVMHTHYVILFLGSVVRCQFLAF